MTTLTLAPPLAPASPPANRPQILYDFSTLFIGKELLVSDRLVRIRSIYAPSGTPRWQHLAEAEVVETGETVSILTGQAVFAAPQPKAGPARYWLKYQGGEVWVIYALRHGQLMRYQGGTFRLLDTRGTATALPEVPRGALEVTGYYAPRLAVLLNLSNDKRYLAGEQMGPEWHEQHEELARELNEIASKSFWHYRQAAPEE